MQISSTLYFTNPISANVGAIAAEIKTLFPAYADQVQTPGGASENDNLLRIGDVIIAILDFDVPQPADVLEDAYRINFAWPEAKNLIGKHRAHVMLAVIGEQDGFENVMAASKALAMAALALAVIRDAIAIHWSSSMALLRGASVEGTAQTMRETGLALDLWLAFKPWVEREQGKVGLFTSGLRGFIGRDIEMVARKESLIAVVERALALAGYILTSGAVIKDGDTVGYSATEQLRIKFVEDGSGPLMQVLTEEIVR
jgi:Domain of unknown function (DUF4261)